MVLPPVHMGYASQVLPITPPPELLLEELLDDMPLEEELEELEVPEPP